MYPHMVLLLLLCSIKILVSFFLHLDPFSLFCGLSKSLQPLLFFVQIISASFMLYLDPFSPFLCSVQILLAYFALCLDSSSLFTFSLGPFSLLCALNRYYKHLRLSCAVWILPSSFVLCLAPILSVQIFQNLLCFVQILLCSIWILSGF